MNAFLKAVEARRLDERERHVTGTRYRHLPDERGNNGASRAQLDAMRAKSPLGHAVETEEPSPAEQERILGELDLERQLEADDDAARERELDERDNETPSRWWTGGLR